MDRREFLTAGKVTSSVTQAKPLSPIRTYSGLTPYAGPWTTNEVVHLLKRTMFGAKRADVDYFKGKTMLQTVDELLTPTVPMPAPPINDYSPGTPDPNVPAGQTWINNPTNEAAINSGRRFSFKKWWAGLMLNQDRSIREKLTLFWANHFSTETSDIGTAHFIYHHHHLLRQSALGNFKTLVKNVTIDPGMLRYLNGYLNTATAPDENYARELQELFTIGKDPVTNLGAFTEDDVKYAARILTGHRINGNTFTYFFDSGRHDRTDKPFSSFYDNTIIKGRTGAAGAQETDDLLNMIFAKNDVSKFIVRKLYRWFVYYVIDEVTEENVIDPLATIFRENNYEIKPVLDALFKSEHFYDLVNQGCLIKSPIDHVIGCLREFGVVFPDPVANYAEAYNMWFIVRSWAAQMAQDLGDPPSVSGWPAYYQAPQYHKTWINSDTLPKRNRFTDTMILNGYTINGKKIIIDVVAFTRTLPNPSDPNALIDAALSIIYRVPLSVQSKQTIKQQILLSNQTEDYYWSNAWNGYMADPTNVTNYNVVNTRLKTLYKYLLGLAEYQLA
jgi:uncharacterized protein (DUF1800 family)